MASVNVPALSGDPVKEAEVRKIQSKVSDNSKLIDEIVSELVKYYCGDLDKYMSYVRKCVSESTSIPDEVLDDFSLSIPVLVYFAGEAQESLGVKEDVANAVKMEVYNKVYTAVSGTVADKTAKAQLETQAEFVAHIAYKRAYNCVKLRVEAAYETLNSIKKVQSRRIAEYGITQNANLNSSMPIRQNTKG